MSKNYKFAHLLPNNDYIDGCDYTPDKPFQSDFVEQVTESTGRLFADICVSLKLNPDSERQLVQKDKLGIRSVTKDKLIEWLENACYLLDTCSLPLLQKAASLVKRSEQLLEEKISDQKSIIDLQKQLLEQKDHGLEGVQSVVENQLSSYSDVLSKNCSNVFNQQKIEKAVRKVVEKEDRSRNVIMCGIEEKDNEVVQEAVASVLEQINEKPLIKECYRVGVKRGNAQRPIKFVLSHSDHAKQVIRNAKKLHATEGYKGVYICPDRTVEERKARKMLWDQVLEKRKSEPDRYHYIRNSTIVSCDKNRKPGTLGLG